MKRPESMRALVIGSEGNIGKPLASYLKALAVLRLVAEAGTDGGGDPGATGFWRHDEFVLRTRLTKEELGTFFLEGYRPTPLIAPWGPARVSTQEARRGQPGRRSRRFPIVTAVNSSLTEARSILCAISYPVTALTTRLRRKENRTSEFVSHETTRPYPSLARCVLRADI